MKNKDLVVALDKFTQNCRQQHPLPPNIAKQNLEQGLVELVYDNGQHAANGLLISNEGHFLTARHCVERDNLPRYLRLHDGKICSIEKVLVKGKGNLDIALAEANIITDFNPNYVSYMCSREKDIPLLP
ncbi:MAG: hypothetical protein AABX05_01255, partial [Nanoarchaeota archaeon]